MRTSPLIENVYFEYAVSKYDSLRGLFYHGFPMVSNNRLVMNSFMVIEDTAETTTTEYIFAFEVDSIWLNQLDHFPGWDQS